MKDFNHTADVKTIRRTAGHVQEEVLGGLLLDKKFISSRFFYDDEGSALFKQITELPEYYPTKTEMGILTANRDELAQFLNKKSLIELGSGDARKISTLIDAIDNQEHERITYYPVDVSASALKDTTDEIRSNFPNLKVQGIVADFVHHIEEIQVPGPKLILFFGSTLGNFAESEAADLLRNIRSIMSDNDILILGLDRVKEQQVLCNAYNDSRGITAKFNLNMLRHINSIIDSDIDPDNFKHKAIYNPDKERIEMYVVAKKEQLITSPYFNAPLKIRKGEEIHTENSHKYSDRSIQELIGKTGFILKDVFSDERNWFSLLLLGLE